MLIKIAQNKCYNLHAGISLQTGDEPIAQASNVEFLGVRLNDDDILSWNDKSADWIVSVQKPTTYIKIEMVTDSLT